MVSRAGTGDRGGDGGEGERMFKGSVHLAIRRVAWIHGHTFHPRYLRPGGVMLDLGANVGRFSRVCVAHFGLRVVAVEAVKELFEQIDATASIRPLHAAVSARQGKATFTYEADQPLGARLEAGSEDEPGVRMLTLGELMALAGPPETLVDLVKMDIEGEELGVLDACSDELLLRIRQITLEFHDFKGMYRAAEAKRRLERLRRLGIRCLRMSRVGHQDVWCINTRLCRLGWIEWMYIAWVIRPTAGVWRLIAKTLRVRLNEVPAMPPEPPHAAGSVASR